MLIHDLKHQLYKMSNEYDSPIIHHFPFFSWACHFFGVIRIRLINVGTGLNWIWITRSNKSWNWTTFDFRSEVCIKLDVSKIWKSTVYESERSFEYQPGLPIRRFQGPNSGRRNGPFVTRWKLHYDYLNWKFQWPFNVKERPFWSL